MMLNNRFLRVAFLMALFPLLALAAEAGAKEGEVKTTAAVASPPASEAAKAKPKELSFTDGFLSSLGMIIVSELGDKTFFIAAIMAMRHPRAVVLAGALGALALMTVLSAAAGFALPNVMPRIYTHWASVVLFVVFGVRLLKEGMAMESGTVSEELEEVENELSKADKKTDVEAAEEGAQAIVKNSILWQAFTLTFLAEWGDRSQIATIALAAQKEPIGVTIGGTIGHALCTGLAVVGGKMLASRITEKTVALSGGGLFLIFALAGVYEGLYM